MPAKAGESLWSFKKSKKGRGIIKRKAKGKEKRKIPTAKAMDIRLRSKRMAYLFNLSQSWDRIKPEVIMARAGKAGST